MIRAYDTNALDCAMDNLGEMLDYAVNICKLDIEEFWTYFIESGYAKLFGDGHPLYVSGLSGTELAIKVLRKVGKMDNFPKASVDFSYSEEYWCGWIMAYYQWSTSMSFSKIHKYVDMNQVMQLYPTLHEAPEDKFINVINHRIRIGYYEKNLAVFRKSYGLSQSALANKSGVNVRMIQQYETGAKDINKAGVMTLVALSKSLNCKIEDLLEPELA